jgi:hypothetical protein
VLIVHGTRKFLDRVNAPVATEDDHPTTALGAWYANVLFWKPQVALFVNEPTLFPVLVPLAPAATLLDRFGTVLADVLTAHGADDTFIERELAEMREYRCAKTNNRSVVGIMNEFAFLGEHSRSHGETDLGALSQWLAGTPCSPLYKSHGSPDRELAALLAAQGTE